MPKITRIKPNKLPSPLNIILVCSQYNSDIAQKLEQEIIHRITPLLSNEDTFEIIEVPGAIEIPIMCRTLAKSGKYHAIITSGVVIRGETSHYDAVVSSCSIGCQDVALVYGIPIIFGVLTVENEAQALERISTKPKQLAKAALDMIKAIYSQGSDEDYIDDESANGSLIHDLKH